MKGKFVQFALGVLTGAFLFGGVTAIAAGTTAEPAWSPIYVDGQQVQMTAYNILGSNFVRLRDIGQAVGFNVYYENGVQVDSDAPYTGIAPKENSESATTTLDLNANMEIRLEMARLINQVRRENGRAELPLEASLMNASQDVSSQCVSEHRPYDHKALIHYGWPHGGLYNLVAPTAAPSEDIAQKAVTAWVNSPGHFQNMLLEEASCLGTGVTIKDGLAYCNMVVGDPTAHNPYE